MESRKSTTTHQSCQAITCQRPYSIIRYNAFALNKWMVKPIATTHLEENERGLQRLPFSCQTMCGNAFGILVNS